ncbi:MAG: TetR/AcrR family transcriptional regulator [Sporichthyaceae bacterium]
MTSAQAESGRRRREASRTEILAATRRLLVEHESVAGLSVDRIAAEAGVSRATFYVCFPDKVAVVGELAHEALSWREQIHAEVLADPHLTRTRLDELMRAIVRHWYDDRAILAAIVELAEHDPAFREPWRAAMAETAEQAAEQFRRRWRRSRDRLDDPEAVASVFTWMLERACHQLVVDEAGAETVALAMSEILWRTLSYRAP